MSHIGVANAAVYYLVSLAPPLEGEWARLTEPESLNAPLRIY